MTATLPQPAAPPGRSPTVTLARGLGLATAAGVVLALTGAFGTMEAPLWLRLVYWVPVMLAGASWGHVCSRLIERWIDMDERPWLTVVGLTALISGPVTLLVWSATGLIFEGRLYALAALPLSFGPVVTITAVMSALNVFLGKAQPVQTHAAPTGTAPARPAQADTALRRASRRFR